MPPPSYSKTQSFARPCGAVWPGVVQVIEQAGFREMQSDRDAGLANFLWTSPQPPVVPGAANPQLLAAGSFRDWGSLRVESALLAFRSGRSGCTADLTISYKGRQSSLLKSEWVEVPSTGLLENRLLAAALPAVASKALRNQSE